jgi:hypothetical protein
MITKHKKVSSGKVSSSRSTIDTVSPGKISSSRSTIDTMSPGKVSSSCSTIDTVMLLFHYMNITFDVEIVLDSNILK